ncbi:NAD(P)H-binding protein [Janthinobacterium sp.]|uniref:NAD(P)H-binding protein n=1 Tax=Janthinobacterium sp. TaxID=1871054 RepID=UPI00293D5606|nr:NAD(P)H-binding protein [Janthinobacterium sp.]
MNTTSAPDGLRLLVLGGSGAVGQQVLRLALADARVRRVIAPTRRALPAHARLENPVVDFARLADDAAPWQADAVICALGTTLRLAGSEAAFAAVDRDLVARLAALARRGGATRFALNSSLGASADGSFYLRVKAEVEQAVRALAYPQYVIVRPSLIDTRRAAARPAEQAGALLARLFRPLIPRRYRAVTPTAIAAALLEGVLHGAPGERIVESESLQD